MNVVAIAGRIASGKSTVARAVAERLSVKAVSFGDAVRSEAARRGSSTDRQSLQRLGDQLIADGWDAFCDLVLEQAGSSAPELVVVDGVRHVDAIKALARKAAPDGVVVAFVDCDWGQRCRQAQARGVTPDDLTRADGDPNETEVGYVRQQATIVVSNGDSLEDIVDLIVDHLPAIGVTTQERLSGGDGGSRPQAHTQLPTTPAARGDLCRLHL